MTTEPWEDGFQSVGPRRLRTFRYPLTRRDHPKWCWELSRLEHNSLPTAETLDVQTTPTMGELATLVGGILRFLLLASGERAKAFLAKKWYRADLPARKARL